MKTQPIKVYGIELKQCLKGNLYQKRRNFSNLCSKLHKDQIHSKQAEFINKENKTENRKIKGNQ